MKVCEKVQRKQITSYNEVADELVNEIFDPATGEVGIGNMFFYLLVSYYPFVRVLSSGVFYSLRSFMIYYYFVVLIVIIIYPLN